MLGGRGMDGEVDEEGGWIEGWMDRWIGGRGRWVDRGREEDGG